MAIRRGFVEVALLLGITFTSPAIERTIDDKVAGRLVAGALAALGENRTSIQIVPWRYYWAPEFYTFSAWRLVSGTFF